jgi:regulator of protease activity HflC (stomatin/prohibitin superfamily)
MIWFVITGIALVLFLLCMAGGVGSTDGESKAFGFGMAAVVLLVWLGLTAYESFHSVPYNNVGVVTQFGAIVGRTGDGLVAVAPWRDLTVESTRVQVKNYTFDQVPSSENQRLTVGMAISYHVNAPQVMGLYNQYGADWYDNLIPEKLIGQTVNTITGQFKAVDAHRNPYAVDQRILARLREELSNKQHGSDVDIVSVNSTYELPDALQAAIVQKQVAIQQAAREHQLIQVAAARGAQKLAFTKKVAAANRVLANSITPKLIQYESLQKLQSNVQVCIIPSGSTVLNPCAVAGATK